MNEYDMRSCRYIKENLRFVFYREFYRDRYLIRRLYNQLDKDAKIFYKWFIYANIHTTIGEKNAIWEFLNDIGEQYDIRVKDLMKKYETK